MAATSKPDARPTTGAPDRIHQPRPGDVGATGRLDGSGPHVTMARRLLALMIDWILCLLASGIFGGPTKSPWAAPLILVVIYTFFVGFFGQTPGMWLTRIRCVDVRNGGLLGVGRSFLRAIVLATLLPALVVDSDQRGLHDRLADSMIIQVGPAGGTG